MALHTHHHLPWLIWLIWLIWLLQSYIGLVYTRLERPAALHGTVVRIVRYGTGTVRRGTVPGEVPRHEGVDGLAPDYEDEGRQDGLQEHRTLLEEIRSLEEDTLLRKVFPPGISVFIIT